MLKRANISTPPQYALDENRKPYRLPDPEPHLLCEIGESLLSLVKSDLQFTQGSKLRLLEVRNRLHGSFPEQFPLVEFTEEQYFYGNHIAHQYYVNGPSSFMEHFLLERSMITGVLHMVQSVGVKDFDISFPTIDNLTITAGFETVLMPDTPTG